jgi:hypothetical protein
MTNYANEDFGRRRLDFHDQKVVEVLPEHFREDYPKLITLLDAYNDFMDSAGNVNDSLRQVLRARDIDGVSLQFLEYLLQEIGVGISGDNFEDPREVAKNFPDFYRVKGSLFSAKAFFRALYGEDAEISYPKDQLFVVGESQIGAESLRYIQNGALYQTLSILVKSSRPITQWRELYKRYVHPAGFYLGGEVLAEGIVNLSLDIMPTAIPDSEASEFEITAIATLDISTPFEPMTGFFQSPDSDTVYRVDLNRTLAAIWNDSASSVDDMYGPLINAATANTVGFDDSNGIDFSNTYETFDRSEFDSAGSNIWTP